MRQIICKRNKTFYLVRNIDFMECHADIVAPQKWDFRFAPTCKNTVTSGEDKLLLVWADDRNGDFDIYGLLMDSLVAVE